MPDIYHYLQQLVNGLTVGSTYALIAIGYTMVYGIIGMINFAHGEVYMIGSYVAFIVIAGLAMLGIDQTSLMVAAAFLASIIVTSAYGYSIERVAYRPLRGGNRLIPLISAIGMSIFLQNFVQLSQDSKDKAIPHIISGKRSSSSAFLPYRYWGLPRLRPLLPLVPRRRHGLAAASPGQRSGPQHESRPGLDRRKPRDLRTTDHGRCTHRKLVYFTPAVRPVSRLLSRLIFFIFYCHFVQSLRNFNTGNRRRHL